MRAILSTHVGCGDHPAWTARENDRPDGRDAGLHGHRARTSDGDAHTGGTTTSTRHRRCAVGTW